MTREEIITLGGRIEKEAVDHGIWVEWVHDDNESVTFEISWGDWKHDHLRFDYLVREMFAEEFPNLDIESWETETDGSDCYSGCHKVIFEDTPWTPMVFEEQKVEEE